MVIFRSPEGKPGYHQAEGIDAAMRFAEMLRNQEQVTDARIFRMDEVPIEFKTYYRVEMVSSVGAGDAPAAPPETSTEAPAEERAADAGAAEAPGDEAAEPVEAGAKGSGRHGIFARG
jgi:hypothetical protein